MSKTTLLLAGLAFAIAAPVAAETVSLPVSYAGLDLASAPGRAILDRRIAHAVSIICGDVNQRELSAGVASRQCARLAMADVSPQLDHALALARHDTRLAQAR